MRARSAASSRGQSISGQAAIARIPVARAFGGQSTVPGRKAQALFDLGDWNHAAGQADRGEDGSRGSRQRRNGDYRQEPPRRGKGKGRGPALDGGDGEPEPWTAGGEADGITIYCQTAHSLSARAAQVASWPAIHWSTRSFANLHWLPTLKPGMRPSPANR